MDPATLMPAIASPPDRAIRLDEWVALHGPLSPQAAIVAALEICACAFYSGPYTHEMEWRQDAYVLTDDKTRLDLDAIMRLLALTYWANQRPRETMRVDENAGCRRKFLHLRFRCDVNDVCQPRTPRRTTSKRSERP